MPPTFGSIGMFGNRALGSLAREPSTFWPSDGSYRGRPLKMIEVEGLRVGYERAGEGPPLVLLHGYVGDGPTLWRRQLEELADEFTVVVWDAPGTGRSADPPETFGMAGYADCLAGFIWPSPSRSTPRSPAPSWS